MRLPKVQTEEPLRAQAQAFVRAIRTGKLDRSGGEFSLGVVRTLDAIANSMRLGGAPVKLS